MFYPKYIFWIYVVLSCFSWACSDATHDTFPESLVPISIPQSQARLPTLLSKATLICMSRWSETTLSPGQSASHRKIVIRYSLESPEALQGKQWVDGAQVKVAKRMHISFKLGFSSLKYQPECERSRAILKCLSNAHHTTYSVITC